LTYFVATKGISVLLTYPSFTVRDGRIPHITQIAASDVNSSREFNCYVIPKVPQSSEAQKISGIVVSSSQKMTVDGKDVEPDTIHTATDKFLKWLEKYQKVVLIAHNGRRFDFPVFISALKSTNNFQKFCNIFVGCIDSLPVFRKVFAGQNSYKQEDLVKSILNASYNAHNALEDVKSLGWLFQHAKMNVKDLLRFSFPPIAVKQQMVFNLEKSKNITSLHPLVAAGVMKTATAENIAGSGLCLQHLRTIVSREGEDGLRNTFTSKNDNGLPRVTNVKRVLDEVVPKMVEYFEK
jgi:hypothetical protein